MRFLEFYVNEIVQCFPLFVCLGREGFFFFGFVFSLVLFMQHNFLRFIHVVVYLNSLFFFIAEWHSVVWIYHNCLSIDLLMDICVLCTI